MIVRFSEPVVYIREGETSIICIESTVNIGVVLDPPILDFSLSSTDDTATGRCETMYMYLIAIGITPI